MVIETKANVDDVLWFIAHNHVHSAVVSKITINITKGNEGMEYSFLHRSEYLDEKKVFLSKEELLKSL